MRALKIIFALSLLGLAAATPACSCSNVRRPPANCDGGGSCTQGALSIDPADVTLDLMSGSTPQTASFKVTYHETSKDVDVTSLVTWVLADQTLGYMGGNVFTCGTAHGGSSMLTATYPAPSGPVSAVANIHVRVKGSFVDTSCSGCPAFPGDMAAVCAGGASVAPTIVYPSDGVLLPPNLNQIEVQFTQGTGNSFYEIDFQNAATDVRVATKCTPVSDTRNVLVTNGCGFVLDQTTWDFIAKSNKGGDPITITIRTTTDGMCATPSTNTSKMSVGEEDIAGGIYYWKSKITPIGTGGDIWRKSFGDAKPEEKISPDTLTGNFTPYPCWGCHTLSRDGLRMTMNVDDSDSDDEYGDTSAGLFDVAQKKFITTIGYAIGITPGFQAFSNDHSLFLASDGDGFGTNMAGGFGSGATNLFWLFKGTDGSPATPQSVTVGPSGSRPTMPDWSVDNKQVVFVLPSIVGGFSHTDDNHIFGGSLYSLAYSGNGTFGSAVELVHSTGDNNYYPTISPDGSLIAFNHVDKQTTSSGALDGCTASSSTIGICPNDSFSNPKARVAIISTAGGVQTPRDLEAANGSPLTAPVDLSNSWPRWSPFLQQYKGQKLLWLTFSTTRDYGLRVRNHVTVNGKQQIQCYPPDSAQFPTGSHSQVFPDNCQQPQIWMAAINITATEQGMTLDPSYPAFWLPFQDIKTHNHQAQWTSSVVTVPPTDCANGGESCLAKPCCAMAGICLATGVCGIP